MEIKKGECLWIIKKNQKMSIVVFLGIIIAVMGILTSLFCILSINRDMTPHGLFGIKGDYKYPFTDYEKSQLSRLAVSTLTFISGTAMIFWGRKVKHYRTDTDTGDFDSYGGYEEESYYEVGHDEAVEEVSCYEVGYDEAVSNGHSHKKQSGYYCKYCKNEIDNDSEYCKYCGNSTRDAVYDDISRTVSNRADNPYKKHDTFKWIVNLFDGTPGNILIIAGFVIILIILIFILVSVLRNNTLAEQLELGQICLAEKDYQQAADVFAEAVKIDPNCADAYYGLALAYSGVHDYNSAYDILEEGFRITGDRRLQQGMEEIEKSVIKIYLD